jgi:hypothetical protein
VRDSSLKHHLLTWVLTKGIAPWWCRFATTLYIGFYFALLLAFAQQGVRIYKHCYFEPDKLCPWDVGPAVDQLLNF